jgi:hypothetical protein
MAPDTFYQNIPLVGMISLQDTIFFLSLEHAFDH